MWVPQPFQGFLLESSTHGLWASPESSQILARKVTHKSSTALWEMVQVSTASLKSAVSSGRLHSAHPVLVTLLGWKTITVQTGSYSGKKWEVTNRKTRRKLSGKEAMKSWELSTNSFSFSKCYWPHLGWLFGIYEFSKPQTSWWSLG